MCQIRNFKDLTGQSFGRLTVVTIMVGSKYGITIWLCWCTCGKFKICNTGGLRSGDSISCGCWRSEKISKARTKQGHHKRSDPMMPEYNIWKLMRKRCLSSTSADYPNYDGRGIFVVPEWNDFSVFLSDMGPRPTPTSTIERLDVNGPYSPTNCIWLEKRLQSKNTRRNRPVTFNGQTKLLSDWSIEVGIKAETLRARLSSGWSILDALTKPLMVNGSTVRMPKHTRIKNPH